MPRGNVGVIFVATLVFLLFLFPIVLSNHPSSSVCATVLLGVLFFFPGYVLLKIAGKISAGLRILLSAVMGMVCVTTLYDLFELRSTGKYFLFVAIAFSVVGVVLFFLDLWRTPISAWRSQTRTEILAAGCLVALCVAPVFWRSGRFSAREFVFYGPEGQDQLFHVTLLQRLTHHVPPDNFLVSGLRPTVYHYFDDLTLELILDAQSSLHLGATNSFDLFYRSYPILVYFFLGALAYRAGRILLGTITGGVLGVLLLLGGGGLGWIFGLLHTIAHVSHPAAMLAPLFFDWTSFEGVNSILPLVHRPAHYHGLLIFLAALNLLIRPDRSRRDWILAGLLTGLMAGYNFSLAAILGISSVMAIFVFLVRHLRSETRELTWFAAFTLLGSMPITAAMIWSGFHNMAPGFPFRGPNLEFPAGVWGTLLHRVVPASAVPLASLILFVIVVYGLRLFGIRAMFHLDLGDKRLQSLAAVLAIAAAISFAVGVFFPYQGLGIAVIFLQPTLWILALFALRPIQSWLTRARWRPIAIWGMLGLTWAQALAAFNFSSKATFSADTVRVFEDIRSSSSPDDVVAFLPSVLTEEAILGYKVESTNFSISAMTGLDGYFSTEPYSVAFAVPGLSGPNPTAVLDEAKNLYRRRFEDIDSFLKGDIDALAEHRLARDHVRWIVVVGEHFPAGSPRTAPWRKTAEVTAYHLAP